MSTCNVAIYGELTKIIFQLSSNKHLISSSEQCGERTGLVVRASDSGSGDPGSILRRVGVLFP